MRIETIEVAKTVSHLSLWATVFGKPLDGVGKGVTVAKLDPAQVKAITDRLPLLETYSLSDADKKAVKAATTAAFDEILNRAEAAGIEAKAAERAERNEGEALSFKTYRGLVAQAIDAMLKALESKATVCEAHLLAEHGVEMPDAKAKAKAGAEDF